jgi:hypothetical protein
LERLNQRIKEFDDPTPSTGIKKGVQSTSVLLNNKPHVTRNAIISNFPMQFDTSLSGTSKVNPMSSGIINQKSSKILMKNFSCLQEDQNMSIQNNYQTAEKPK